jgi:hypothetical protein
VSLPPRQIRREQTSVDNGSERPVSNAMHREKKPLDGNCYQPLVESRFLIGGILFGVLALGGYGATRWYYDEIVLLGSNKVGDLRKAEMMNRLAKGLPSKDSNFDVQLVTWGGGAMVPFVGKNLFVVGSDLQGVLHIRVFDANGKRIRDTDETQLPQQTRKAIEELKQKVKKLSPPHDLTRAEKSGIVAAASSIVNIPQSAPEVEQSTPQAGLPSQASRPVTGQ